MYNHDTAALRSSAKRSSRARSSRLTVAQLRALVPALTPTGYRQRRRRSASARQSAVRSDRRGRGSGAACVCRTVTAGRRRDGLRQAAAGPQRVSREFEGRRRASPLGARGGAWTSRRCARSRSTRSTRRSDNRAGLAGGDDWDATVAALDALDPHRIFSNAFLDTLMP